MLLFNYYTLCPTGFQGVLSTARWYHFSSSETELSNFVNILDVIWKNDGKVDDEVGFCSFLQPSVKIRHHASSSILRRKRGDSSKNCTMFMMLIEVHVCWLTAD